MAYHPSLNLSSIYLLNRPYRPRLLPHRSHETTDPIRRITHPGSSLHLHPLLILAHHGRKTKQTRRWQGPPRPSCCRDQAIPCMARESADQSVQDPRRDCRQLPQTAHRRSVDQGRGLVEKLGSGPAVELGGDTFPANWKTVARSFPTALSHFKKVDIEKATLNFTTTPCRREQY